MTQKVYYDAVNNKEVVDVSGIKDEQKVKDEFALDPTVQIIVLDEGDVHYVDAGILKKKDKATQEAEAAADKAIKDAEKDAKKSAIKTKLGLSDAEFADLKAALA